MPPFEALAAYAQCTNQPLNDDERILLRATDLHIALGARIGEPLKRYGIRYYPEKGYDLAIDWLAAQDVPLVRRAVTGSNHS